MLKNDRWIKEMAKQGMIAPFEPQMVRWVDTSKGVPVLEPDPAGLAAPVISYGLGSYGYDIRLDPGDFQIFRHEPGLVVNPKNFSPVSLEPARLLEDEWGQYFILPAHSYGLGVAMERIDVPDNITVLCVGKSTYARVGLIANVTPAEADWRGYLTLEFSNSSSADCRIFAGEGCLQLLFLEGEPCRTSYENRPGGQKYQDQKKTVTLPRV